MTILLSSENIHYNTYNNHWKTFVKELYLTSNHIVWVLAIPYSSFICSCGTVSILYLSHILSQSSGEPPFCIPYLYTIDRMLGVTLKVLNDTGIILYMYARSTSYTINTRTHCLIILSVFCKFLHSYNARNNSA